MPRVCFCAGKASEVLRKSMKDVLPDPFAPTTRMLCDMSMSVRLGQRLETIYLLEGFGIFATTHPAWRVHTGRDARSIAFTSATDDALGTWQ